VCLLEDLKCPVVIGLASNDCILPARAVKKYAELLSASGEHDKKPMVDVIWWEGVACIHGYCMLVPEAVRDVIRVVRGQEEKMEPVCFRLKHLASLDACATDNDDDDDTCSESSASTPPSSPTPFLHHMEGTALSSQ